MVSRVSWSSGEDPAPVGPPLNLVLYIHLRIFTYLSNILIANFDPMDSNLKFFQGTWKNLMFFLRSCSFRERDPPMKLICSTCHPWCCNVALRVRRRDSFSISDRDWNRMRYWSVTSLMCLNSKMQKMTVFVSVGSRNTIPSGLSHQNLALLFLYFGLPLLVSVLLELGDDSFRDPSLCSIWSLSWCLDIVGLWILPSDPPRLFVGYLSRDSHEPPFSGGQSS